MMKVVWFNMTVRDLESLKDYITQDNPRAAQKIVLSIKANILLLISGGLIPRSSPQAPTFGAANVTPTWLLTLLKK